MNVFLKKCKLYTLLFMALMLLALFIIPITLAWLFIFFIDMVILLITSKFTETYLILKKELKDLEGE